MTAPTATRVARFDGLIDSIGGTSIVEIARLSPSPAVRRFAKVRS